MNYKNNIVTTPHPDSLLPRLTKELFLEGKEWHFKSTRQPAYKYILIGKDPFIEPQSGYSLDPIPITQIKGNCIQVWVNDNAKWINFQDCILKQPI